MENRKIIIVSTKSQKKYILNTDATTLAELKTVCAEQGIDYTGMSWFEGTSKTEMTSDNSVLPHDVPYKGTTTNNLVFRLTPAKKIASGAVRADLYAKIKSLHLEETVKDTFGVNYTRVSNNNLEKTIEEAMKANSVASISVMNLVEILVNKGILTWADFNTTETEESPYSDSEIEEMFEI